MPTLQETAVEIAVSQLGVHEQGGKRCPKCLLTKPLSSFSLHRRKRSGKRSRCKQCEAADADAYRQRDLASIRQRERLARAARPEIQRANDRRWKLKRYGLTPASLYELTRKQNGYCAACGLPPSGKGTNSILHVDHDHRTGNFRGLICNPCNVALGMARDNAQRLIDLAAYAERTAS